MPPVSPPQPQMGTAQQQPVDPYDFSSDPALLRIQALGQRTIAEAEADALRQRRQLALDYGDAQAARELGLSEADIAAAGANPFSVRAKQAKAAVERPKELSANLSKANLGYSSAGATQQTDLATGLLEDQSNAARDFQGASGGIAQHLLEARRGVEEGNWQAQQDAATRRQEQMGDRSYAPAGGGEAEAPPIGQALARHGVRRAPSHRQRSGGHRQRRMAGGRQRP